MIRWLERLARAFAVRREEVVHRSTAAGLMAAADDPIRRRRVLRRIARRLKEIGVI